MRVKRKVARRGELGGQDFALFLRLTNSRIGAKKGRPREEWLHGRQPDTMKYVCRLHPDIVLYEDPPPETVVGRILGNIAEVLEPVLRGAMVLFPTIVKPKECPVDGKLYYKWECKKVES